MQVTLEYAEAHLADLLAAARQGEEIEIAEQQKPPVKLVSQPRPANLAAPNVNSTWLPRHLTPLTPEQWALLKQGIPFDVDGLPFTTADLVDPGAEAYLEQLRTEQDKERIARGLPSFADTPLVFGSGVGKMIVPTEEEWRAMKQEDAREMNDAPLTSGSNNW